jgi:hypothetical protein
MLDDALNEMILAYKELGKEIPLGNALIAQLPLKVSVKRRDLVRYLEKNGFSGQKSPGRSIIETNEN